MCTDRGAGQATAADAERACMLQKSVPSSGISRFLPGRRGLKASLEPPAQRSAGATECQERVRPEGDSEDLRMRAECADDTP